LLTPIRRNKELCLEVKQLRVNHCEFQTRSCSKQFSRYHISQQQRGLIGEFSQSQDSSIAYHRFLCKLRRKIEMATNDGDRKSPDRNTDAEDNLVDDDENFHLLKISDYKTYCKGLMDIALLSANANQLRHALELCAPYRTLLIVLFSLSIVLQVVAGVLLLVERLTCKKKDYVSCHRYNVAIGILILVVIVINILGTAFGGPDLECEKPLT